MSVYSNNTEPTIKKEDIIRNTLFKEIIRIDLFRIKELEEFLFSIDSIIKDLGFKFKTNEIEGVDLEINDPDDLKTQQFMKNTKKTISYEYVNELNEKLVINEYMILFQKKNFKGYKGIDGYINMLSKIMGELLKIGKVSIERIGIRKVNRVTGRKLKVISKVFKFDEINLDEVKDYENYKNFSKKTLQDSKKNNINVLKTLNNGIFYINGEDVPSYRTVLDIDAYCREYENELSENGIKTKLIELASSVFEQFISYDNETLKKILTQPDGLKEMEIYEGVNEI